MQHNIPKPVLKNNPHIPYLGQEQYI